MRGRSRFWKDSKRRNRWVTQRSLNTSSYTTVKTIMKSNINLFKKMIIMIATK